MSTDVRQSKLPDGNYLLASLPPEELDLIEPHLEPISLPRRALMYDAGQTIEHVHFIRGGIASILSVLGDGSGVETATIGREGLVGMAVFHGMQRTPEHAMMQVPGDGYRIRSELFRSLLPQLPTLTAMLHRYSVYLFSFVAQNSACNRTHSAEQRLARWLLIVHDRMGIPELRLTHDFMSQMLGVRRATVTDVLADFERRNIVRTGRARVTIVDPDALARSACECYAVIRAALDAYICQTDGPTVFADLPLAMGDKSLVGDEDEPMISESPGTRERSTKTSAASPLRRVRR